MKKLLKAVMILILLVAVGYCVGGYLVGTKAETFYRKTLIELSRTDKLSFTCSKYERGIFSSEAETEVAISEKAGGAGEVQKITLKHSITHGPLAIIDKPYSGKRIIPALGVIETRLAAGPDTQAELKKVYERVPELRSSENLVLIDLMGGGEAWIFIPAFKAEWQGETPVAVKWDGLNGHMTFSEDLKALHGSLSAPGCEVKSAEVEARMRPIEWLVDGREDANGIFVGDFSFTFAGMELKTPAAAGSQPPEEVRVDSVAIKSVTGTTGDSAKSSLIFSFDKVVAGGHTYGPFLFDLEVRKLDAAVLGKFSREVKELNEKASQMNAQELQGRMAAKFVELATGILAGAPEIEIRRATLATDRGDFTGKAILVFGKTGARAVENPLLILNAITASADVTIAEALLDDTIESILLEGLQKQSQTGSKFTKSLGELAKERRQDQIKDLIMQKYLVKEGAVYKSSATYKTGKIELNGRGISIAELMQK